MCFIQYKDRFFFNNLEIILNILETNPPQPHIPGLPIIHVNNITMIWMIEKENNQCTLQNIITICNVTGSDGRGYELTDGYDITSIDPDVAATPIVVINTTVENLSPFTSYTCRAQTANIAGYSELSDGINVTTLETGEYSHRLFSSLIIVQLNYN